MLTIIITIILFHLFRLEKLNPRYFFLDISWVYFNIQKIRQETLTGKRMRCDSWSSGVPPRARRHLAQWVDRGSWSPRAPAMSVPGERGLRLSPQVNFWLRAAPTSGDMMGGGVCCQSPGWRCPGPYSHLKGQPKSKIYFLMGSHSDGLSHFNDIESSLVIGFLVGCVLGTKELELEAGKKGHNAWFGFSHKTSENPYISE